MSDDYGRQYLSGLPKQAAILTTLVGGIPTPVGPDNPLVAGGGAAAGGASEATLQLLLAATQALGGNTDGLESLLTNLGAYNDQVEGLLNLLNTNTDGIESLLSSLGIKDDNVLTKLEQLRVLLAGTLTVNTGLTGLATDVKLEAVRALLAGTLNVNTGNPNPATSTLQSAGNTTLSSLLGLVSTETTQAAVLAKLELVRGILAGNLTVQLATANGGQFSMGFAANADTGSVMALNGLSVVSFEISSASWTPADLSFEHSADSGITWRPMYDAFGTLVTYKVAAGRSVTVPIGDLYRRKSVRARSGVPGAYVAQPVAVTITALTAMI